MNSKTVDLTDWLKTPPGQYLLAWEDEQFKDAVSDMFGYHALQLGLPELDTLQANRMPHQWLALQSLQLPAEPIAAPSHESDTTATSFRPRADLMTDSCALPFAANSLDLVVLPHTLEQSHDPHVSLREVERVLVPEGHVVISGLNPASLWGMRQSRGHFYRQLGHEDMFLPESGEFIGYWRLRDWLRLLSFEVESARFGCYRPALTSQKWLNRFDWMDPAGKRWWPIFGAVYFVVAVKRVRGMRLLETSWTSRRPVAAAPVAIANKTPAAKNKPLP